MSQDVFREQYPPLSPSPSFHHKDPPSSLMQAAQSMTQNRSADHNNSVLLLLLLLNISAIDSRSQEQSEAQPPKLAGQNAVRLHTSALAQKKSNSRARHKMS